MPLITNLINKPRSFYLSCSEDPYWNNVVLMMHMNNESGTTNFIEETGKVVTVNGNTSLVNTQSKFGGYSGYFDGSGDYLTVPTSSDFDFGAGDFTIEFWVYYIGGTEFIGKGSTYSTNGDWTIHVYAGAIKFGTDAGFTMEQSYNIANVWHHIAVTRSNNVFNLFVDGSIIKSVTSTVIIPNTPDKPVYIGSRIDGSYSFNGYIDDLRITKGVARYSENPTKLLMHFESNTGIGFKEEISGLYLTGNSSNIKLADSAKFGSTCLYNAGAMHSSLAYTAGQDLSGTDDFTIEFWFKRPTNAGVTVILSKGDGFGIEPGFDWAVSFYNGTFNFYWTQPNNSTTSSLSSSFPEFSSTQNTWHHLAIVRQGTTLKHIINGTVRASQTMATTITNRTDRGLAFGSYGDNSYNSTCYIDEVRISKGIARYTETFLLPSNAFTVDANTGVLCHFEGSVNAQNFLFKEETGKAITLTGNPSIISNQSALGTTSTVFSSGNYLTVSGSNDFVFGTGDFTVECWVYCNTINSSGSGNCILDARTGIVSQPFTMNVAGSGGVFGANRFFWYNNNGFVITTTGITPQTNIWYHIAVVRNNSVTKIFIDGIERASASDTTNYTTGNNNILIGRNYDGHLHDGYLNELRISKGIARYTANFTPSTAKFAVDANTSLLCHFDSLDANGVPVEETGKSFTKSGSLILASSSSKFGTSSLYLNGSSYLTIPNSVDFNFGAGNFTIECWIYRTAVNDTNYADAILCSAVEPKGVAIAIFPDGKIGFSITSSTGPWAWDVRQGADPGDPRSTTIVNLNTWTHIALVRNGNTFTGYTNGIADQTFTSSLSVSNLPGGYNIGHWHDAWQRCFKGYIDEFRITNGLALYTSNFITSDSPFVYEGGVISESNPLPPIEAFPSCRKIIVIPVLVKGYVGGGYISGHSGVTTVDGFSFTNEVCTALTATLSSNKFAIATVNSSTKGYFAGGFYYDSYGTGAVDILTVSTEAIVNSSLSCTGRGSQAGVNSTTKGYIAGGHSSTTGVYYNLIENVLFSSDTFSNITAVLNAARMECGSLFSNTTGYFLGGKVAGFAYTPGYAQSMSDIDGFIFSSETVTNPSSTLYDAKTGLIGVNATSKGYLAGGCGGGTGVYGTDIISSFNFTTEAASTISSKLNIYRSGASGVYSSANGYFAGGYTSTSGAINDIEGLTFTTETVFNPTATLSSSRMSPSGISII